MSKTSVNVTPKELDEIVKFYLYMSEGGTPTLHFTPSSVGDKIEVSKDYTGNRIDVTDYDSL